MILECLVVDSLIMTQSDLIRESVFSDVSLSNQVYVAADVFESQLAGLPSWSANKWNTFHSQEPIRSVELGQVGFLVWLPWKFS